LLQGLPQLEPAIMEGLFWPAAPSLTSPHPAEPGISGLRESLSASLTAALLPLRDYLSLWCALEPLLASTPEAIMSVLAAKGAELTLAEVTTEVQQCH